MFTAQNRYGRDPSVVVRTETWDQPARWQRNAGKEGRRELVFTCSWSDWFHQDADAWRGQAWRVVRDCPNLTFQILTKRPDRVIDHLPADWKQGYSNVWLGVSVENADYLWRMDFLRQIPAAVRFISAEPLLGPLSSINLDGIDWLIVGGESGPGFRSMQAAWARELRDKALWAGVAFFYKQGAAARTEMHTSLDGRQWRQMPAVWETGGAHGG